MKTMKRTKRNDRLATVRELGKTAMAGVEAARENAAVRVEEARAIAIDTVNQFERAFEARMTRAMSRLGVPTAREVRALAREVATLKASVQRLSRSRSRARA
jgi:poly(hydroxyalkanoate) granule-associated protein